MEFTVFCFIPGIIRSKFKCKFFFAFALGVFCLQIDWFVFDLKNHKINSYLILMLKHCVKGLSDLCCVSWVNDIYKIICVHYNKLGLTLLVVK